RGPRGRPARSLSRRPPARIPARGGASPGDRVGRRPRRRARRARLGRRLRGQLPRRALRGVRAQPSGGERALSRILPLLMGLVVGAGSLAGCHRSTADKAGEAAPDAASAKRSFDGLRTELGELTARFSALRKQVEAVPQDLPGFREVRAQFYALEEG